MDAPDCVRNYKSLANVERAFRSLKTIDLKVRPIHHRTADRVRAHIFLCMLAYYVEWHMREAWRELMFADTEQQAKATRDPVAPAKRSNAALAKVGHSHLKDGTPPTASPPCWPNSPPSCAILAARPMPDPTQPTFEVTHHCQPQTEARTPTHSANQPVDRNWNPKLRPSACQAKKNSLRTCWNFGLGNLCHLPDHLIQIICRCLPGESFVVLGEANQISGSRAHGAVQAVGSAM